LCCERSEPSRATTDAVGATRRTASSTGEIHDGSGTTTTSARARPAASRARSPPRRAWASDESASAATTL